MRQATSVGAHIRRLRVVSSHPDVRHKRLLRQLLYIGQVPVSGPEADGNFRRKSESTSVEEVRAEVRRRDLALGVLSSREGDPVHRTWGIHHPSVHLDLVFRI